MTRLSRPADLMNPTHPMNNSVCLMGTIWLCACTIVMLSACVCAQDASAMSSGVVDPELEDPSPTWAGIEHLLPPGFNHDFHERYSGLAGLMLKLRAAQDVVDQAVRDAKDGRRYHDLVRLIEGVGISVQGALASLTPANPSQDGDGADVWLDRYGQRGTLYLVWSFKDPNAEYLPRAIRRLWRERPDVPLMVMHVAPLEAWEELWLLHHDLDKATRGEIRALDAADIRRKAIELRTAARPLGLMQRTFGVSGFPLFPDTTIAIVQRVDATPSWTYVSRSGMLHRLVGVDPHLSLAQWIGNIEAWESKRKAEYERHGGSVDDLSRAVYHDWRTLKRDR